MQISQPRVQVAQGASASCTTQTHHTRARRTVHDVCAIVGARVPRRAVRRGLRASGCSWNARDVGLLDANATSRAPSISDWTRPMRSRGSSGAKLINAKAKRPAAREATASARAPQAPFPRVWGRVARRRRSTASTRSHEDPDGRSVAYPSYATRSSCTSQLLGPGVLLQAPSRSLA